SEDGRAVVENLVPADRLERDAHGNIRLSGGELGMAIEQLLREGLPGARARVDTFGYLPRGNISTINTTDAREAFEAGAFAVEAAARGGGSVALQYANGATNPQLVPLANVAGKTQHLPDNFLLDDANQISAACHSYFERLLPKRFTLAEPL
ncbi:MAG: 6-phosphofructokinase, partial [Pyrinomonadaceae bacterium]